MANKAQQYPYHDKGSENNQDDASDLVERFGNGTIIEQPKQDAEYQAANDKVNHQSDGTFKRDHIAPLFTYAN